MVVIARSYRIRLRRSDGKLRDAAIRKRKEELDCFVARAPRNDGYFFPSPHAGSGGPNASSPEIFARIL
jgi:hypothetical protein